MLGSRLRLAQLKHVWTIDRTALPNMSLPQPTLADRFREISQPGYPDYSTRLQILCEFMWQGLEHNSDDASAHVNGFVDLLRHGDNILLAKLVMPDLRCESPRIGNALKRSVLSQLQPLSQHPRMLPVGNNIQEAHRLYSQETEILREVDMYQAGTLLYNRGNLSGPERRAVDRWLSDAPSSG
jgi:hypothetical protein